MKRLLLLFLLLTSLLFAAEIKEGSLYLQINLGSAESIYLTSASLEVSEDDPLFADSFSGDIQFTLPSSSELKGYGIIETFSDYPFIDGKEGVRSGKFIWEDGSLVLKEEYLYYLSEGFADLSQAQDYALAMGYPLNSIQAIPVVNSSIRVNSSDGSIAYFESPLKLYSEEGIEYKGLTYKGEFALKAIGNQLILNHIVSLEEYIAGVVPNEIGPNSPLEALKAQTVAARTHAISLLLYNRHAAEGFDLCSGTHCQVYKGKYLQNSAIEAAVEETLGQILITDSRVADATYHSSCGGKTEASSEIWNGKPIPHLSGSLCIPQASSYNLRNESDLIRWINTPLSFSGMSSWEKAALNWERKVLSTTAAKNLGLSYINSISVLKRGYSGRALSVKISGNKDVTLTGEYKIRQSFGNLPSSLFYVRIVGGNLVFKGRGSGHGVGMCQLGALRKARAGESYLSILQNYYPSTTISDKWMRNE